MKLAPEGLIFCLPPLILSAGLLIPGWWAGSIFFFLLAAALAFFPRSVTPAASRGGACSVTS